MSGNAFPPGLISVVNPWTNEVLRHVESAGSRHVDMALERARRGAIVMAAQSRAARADVLERTASSLEADSESAARRIASECGKVLRQARKEVRRAVHTLRLSAAAARDLCGQTLPFDAFAGNEGVTGFFERVPLGIILAVTPFNDPLNLVAHKLGPALAGGNAVLLKPSDWAPLSAIDLVSRLMAAGLPPEAVTVLNGGPEVVDRLARARDVRMISFTGGPCAAEAIVAAGGVKRYAMDLGGNAPVLVMADADLDAAVESCVSGSYWAAGQNCVGVQRILIEKAVARKFTEAFVEKTRALKFDDPLDETSDIGPMINNVHAARVDALIDQAISVGATPLLRGKREGARLPPAVLGNTPGDTALFCSEAFGPVVSLIPVDDFESGLMLANATDVALHAGVFTRDLDRAFRAVERIEASGVMVNMSSDFRLDAMPFGGFKSGSVGREGVRFALEEMTQTKVVAIARASHQA